MNIAAILICSTASPGSQTQVRVFRYKSIDSICKALKAFFGKHFISEIDTEMIETYRQMRVRAKDETGPKAQSVKGQQGDASTLFDLHVSSRKATDLLEAQDNDVSRLQRTHSLLDAGGREEPFRTA